MIEKVKTCTPGAEYSTRHGTLYPFNITMENGDKGQYSSKKQDQPYVVEGKEIEYELDLAAQWYPAGKSLPIVVDPRISSGVPTIKGRGVTIQVIHKRFKAGPRMDSRGHRAATNGTRGRHPGDRLREMGLWPEPFANGQSACGRSKR